VIDCGSFRPLFWLENPHLQTLYPVVFKGRAYAGRKQRLELPDGDFLDLVWGSGAGALVLVMHGLEGSIRSHYASAIMTALDAAGYQAVFMHFRGCSGEPNRLDRAYHSGDTADMATVAEHVSRTTTKPLYATIAYSLGANAMLKWLGETGEAAPMQKAVAVSVPFQLADADQRLSSGASRIYREYLLGHLRAAYRRKFAHRPSPLAVDVDKLRTFYQFDDQVTAPLHGFSGADDYYQKSSCRQYLRGIRKNTLIIHAEDDPFLYPASIPPETDLSASVVLELSEHGGHVGFMAGKRFPQRWLESRILRFMES